MKKTKLTQIAASILLLTWLLCSCGGDKKQTEEDVFGSDPTLPATAPAQHSTATTTQPQPNTVIADAGDGTATTTEPAEEDPIIKELMEGGYTRKQAAKIKAIMPALKKEAKGYTQITDRLMGSKYTSMFRSKRGAIEEYRTPLNALNYWGRYRGSRSDEEELKTQMKIYADWRIDHHKSTKMLENLDLVETAWKLTPQYEFTNPN